MKSRILRILSVLFFLTCVTYGQDPYLQRNDEQLEEAAVQLMREYQDDLGMTVDQALLFKQKVTEFLIREDKIKGTDMSAKEKIQLLRKLSKQETAEMANILTAPQLRAYRKLKKTLQPIVVVVGEVDQ